MDAIVVFDATSEELEEKIQTTLLDEGWIRFNTDIKGAFDNAVKALLGDGSRLPIDFHVVTFNQVEEAFRKADRYYESSLAGAVERPAR